MAQLKEQDDLITQLDDTFDAWMAIRWPRLHRVIKWYIQTHLANIHPRAAWLALLVMGLILIASLWPWVN